MIYVVRFNKDLRLSRSGIFFKENGKNENRKILQCYAERAAINDI